MKTSISKEMIVQNGEPDPVYDDQFTVYQSSLTQQELEEVIVFERLSLYNSLKPCGATVLRVSFEISGIGAVTVDTYNRQNSL